jgi:hypothetical protein
LATPFTAKVIVNPNYVLSISGNQSICGNGKATISLSGTGPFPVDIILSDGSTFTMTGSPMDILVSPTATTTYTIISPSGSGCIGGGITGSAKVTVINTAPPVGTWVCGTGDGDWFNPCNWGGGVVPDNTINVTIAASAGCSAVIDTSSTYAPADKIARSKNLTIDAGKTVSFAAGKAGELEIAGNWMNNAGPVDLFQIPGQWSLWEIPPNRSKQSETPLNHFTILL